ncbi:MAG: tyrosine-type recombinase/integrase [Bacilli bacterium]|nr:tyrosine-type recombinase/integrase [Bacilli bacterium]
MVVNIDELENNLDRFLTDLKDDELADGSLGVYKTNVNQFVNYLKENNKSSFDKETYINYRNYMKDTKHYKIPTINKYVVILNKYISYLGHPELKIKQLKYQRKHYIDNVPTVIDYKRILRAAKKNDIQAYYVIQIASYTGMRVSAICNITIEALKESKKNDDYIKILSKGKYNEVPFPAWLRREVLQYAKDCGIKSGYLFPSPRNKDKPLCRKTMWSKVHKATGKAKVDLDKGHPHAFRHLLGKEITAELNDDQAVSDILGHESKKTTALYQQKTKKEISKILNNFRFK